MSRMRLINNSAQLISVGFTHQKEQQKLQQKQQQQKQEENNNESSFYPGGWRVLKKVKSFPRSSSLARSLSLSLSPAMKVMLAASQSWVE